MERVGIARRASKAFSMRFPSTVYAETLLPGRGGIGRYPKDAKHPKRMTGWVHIDTRTNKSRWKG